MMIVCWGDMLGEFWVISILGGGGGGLYSRRRRRRGGGGSVPLVILRDRDAAT